MNNTVTEKSAAYELTWTLRTVTADGGERALELEYAVTAHEEMFISDRLWVGDVVHSRVPDPYGVYRFVKDDSLRLVLAQAPAPPNVRLGNPYRPLYSKIAAGETRRQTVRIALPVDEYSALARDVSSPTSLEEVSRVYLVIGYRLRKDMDREPLPPPNESAEGAGYVVYAPKLMISEMHVEGIPVKRRTGYIARFPLPGEPGPAPMPVGSP